MGQGCLAATFDAENAVKSEKGTRPFVRVSENGQLLPSVLQLIDFIAQHHDLVLETGHISGEEGDLVVHAARQRGVTHVVVTHAMAASVRMTLPQMQAAAGDGAFIEFVYGATLGTNPAVSISDYAKAIRALGPKPCILATDFGAVQKPPEPQRPLEPQGLLDFMTALHKEGISVADINLMTKTNPALALRLNLDGMRLHEKSFSGLWTILARPRASGLSQRFRYCGRGGWGQSISTGSAEHWRSMR